MTKRKPPQFLTRFPGRFQIRSVGVWPRCVFVICHTRQDLDASIDRVVQGAAWSISVVGVVKSTKTGQPLLTVSRTNRDPAVKPGRAAEV